jgi:hypothetical protein
VEVEAKVISGCSSPCIFCQDQLNADEVRYLQLHLFTLWCDIQEAVFVPVIATGRPLDDFVGLVGGLRLCFVCSRSRLARRHLDAASGKQRRDEEWSSGVVK